METTHRRGASCPEKGQRKVRRKIRRACVQPLTNAEAGESNAVEEDARRIHADLQRQVRKHAADAAALRQEQEHLRLLLDLQEQQWRLVAYEIHDGLAQLLAGAQMHLRTFEQAQSRNPRQARGTFETGMRLLDRSLAETRRLIGDLRPPIMRAGGVTAAIKDLVDEVRQPGGPKIEFQDCLGPSPLPAMVENALFRIVQEALTNAVRYSKSDLVRVEMRKGEGGRVHLEIRDWGEGFDLARVRENSFGLEGMRQRARLLKGETVIHAAPGKGTRITVDLPVPLR